jgi:hypothetical protein
MLPGYLLGTVFLGIGVLARTTPAQAQLSFGVPVVDQANADAEPGSSQTVYLCSKADRDIALGATALYLQYQGNASAIAWLAGVVSLCSFVDGYAVWRHCPEELKRTAYGHWLLAAVTALASIKSRWWLSS